MLDSTYDISLYDRIRYMTMEEMARFLAGISCHGDENRIDVERWLRNLESNYLS